MAYVYSILAAAAAWVIWFGVYHPETLDLSSFRLGAAVAVFLFCALVALQSAWSSYRKSN